MKLQVFPSLAAGFARETRTWVLIPPEQESGWRQLLGRPVRYFYITGMRVPIGMDMWRGPTDAS